MSLSLKLLRDSLMGVKGRLVFLCYEDELHEMFLEPSEFQSTTPVLNMPGLFDTPHFNRKERMVFGVLTQMQEAEVRKPTTKESG